MRGEEPARLRHERRRRLARACLAHARGEKPDFVGYGVAWTWDNLLFTCHDCNGHKANWYGLEADTPSITAPAKGIALDASMPCFDLTSERAMLVDPGCDDPTRHIRWVPDDPHDTPERFRWRPVHLTTRGRYTINALQLHGGLRDHVTSHITQKVWIPWVKDVVQKTAQGKTTEARRRWRAALPSLFAPMEPYHAATADALRWFAKANHLLPRDFPRPPLRAAAEPVKAVDLPDPPRLASQPDIVRLLVRAAPNAEEAILALCGTGPWSAADLAGATGYAESTVAAACRALKTQGALKCARGGWSR